MLTAALISLVVTQAPSLSDGRAWVSQLYDGRTASLWAGAGPVLRAQLPTEAALKGFAGKLQGDFGKELRVISEGLTTRGEFTVYRRVAVFSSWARGVELEILFDASGRGAGVSAKIASTAAPTTYGTRKNRTPLRLPIDGSWYVLWGGRTFDDNRHAAVPDMRYALDLLVLRGPSTFDGDGTKNEQYGAWGRPVVAPADGTVVALENKIADNDPNMVRVGSLYGNYVVVDHGNGEFSLVGHLMKGSVSVRIGQLVTQGAVLAKTGNSGMSTEPHLHYQLMDQPDWLLANGMPAQFLQVVTNGHLIDRGEPRRGDVVEQASLEASTSDERPTRPARRE